MHLKQFTHFCLSILGPSSLIEIAPSPQALMQAPQPMHLLGDSMISGRYDWDSGFAHHLHRKGHPFRNTKVLSPCPSCIEHFCMLKIIAFAPSAFFSFRFSYFYFYMAL